MAQAFTDSQNREWRVVVSVPTAKRVRELTGRDAFDLEALASDPIAFVDVLYALIKPQADAAGVTDEDFGEAIAGPAMLAATEALWRALADFREGHPQAVAIRKAIEAQRMAETQIGEKLERLNLSELANLEAIRVCQMVDDVEKDVARRAIIRQMRAASGASSTDAPESAE